MTKFNENLLLLRRRKNILQKDFAKLCGIDKRTICHYESGKMEPTLSKIIKMTEVLECSYDELIGG